MAVIFGVYDPDDQRRAQLKLKLGQSLSGLNLAQSGCARGTGWDVYWEGSSTTPVSTAQETTADGPRSAWVVGDFRQNHRLESDAAHGLLCDTAQGSLKRTDLTGQLGYYCALLAEPGGRLWLGTDTLGLYPLYCWSRGSVFLFGTSPELFKAHPLFQTSVNVRAVASVLMLQHMSGDESLYQGVRRCPSAHTLVWSAQAQTVQAVKGRGLALTDASFGLGRREAQERAHAIFEAYHANLSELPRVSLMLSGGQDSRMAAAYLSRAVPRERVRAISLGRRGDQELKFARQVARHAGWRHQYRDVAADAYAELALSQLKLETLQGPFANFGTNSARPMLAEVGAPFLNGYFGDGTIGDTGVMKAHDERTGAFTFDAMFGAMRSYGFSDEMLTEVLPKGESLGLILDVKERLRAEWSAIEGLDFQRALYFFATNRQRFHVGSIFWRLSLGAWPLSPYIHRPLQDFVGGLPLVYLRGRILQAGILRENFPGLARIPFDENAERPRYLTQSRTRRVLASLPRLSELSWTLHRWLGVAESRYYYRTYDFNSPGWASVRGLADASPMGPADFWQADEVSRVLPKHHETRQFDNLFTEAAPIKTLLGLKLWQSRFLGLDAGQ